MSNRQAPPVVPEPEIILTRKTDAIRLPSGSFREQPVLTDGPFAETREQIGGYYMIEAQSVEEAVEIAGRIPSARIGTVEVRPVREVEGLSSV